MRYIDTFIGKKKKKSREHHPHNPASLGHFVALQLHESFSAWSEPILNPSPQGQFIYLLGKYLISPLWGRLVASQGKTSEEKEENDQGTEGKTTYPNPGNRHDHRGGRTK